MQWPSLTNKQSAFFVLQVNFRRFEKRFENHPAKIGVTRFQLGVEQPRDLHFSRTNHAGNQQCRLDTTINAVLS